MRRRHMTAVTAILAAVLGCAACAPIAAPDLHPTPANYACSTDPGWVCGTCPDGKEWGYLDDPQYTNDPQISTFGFDDKHPCGADEPLTQTRT